MTEGKKIKNYLQRKGITMAWLSRDTGISQSRLYMIIGRNQSINCRDYYIICKSLGVPYEYFIEGGEDA